jgi:very-short-patch-repair endonuclease
VSALERRWELCWRAVNGPDLVREHRFIMSRRWRFDFAHLETSVAVEIEGGTWTGGRHTRGSGFVADAEKYNVAAIEGWTVFRLPGPLVGTEWAERIATHIRSRMT